MSPLKNSFLSGEMAYFPDETHNSERICEVESWQIWTASIMLLLSTKTPVFVDRQYQNQLLSMKSWILVDRMQNNRDFTLSRFIHSGSFYIIS
jgi:hypothetical protein